MGSDKRFVTGGTDDPVAPQEQAAAPSLAELRTGEGFGPTPPESVLELAAACVRFVAASVQLEPDFTPETMPLVDHYLREARVAVRQRPETLSLVANAIGVYLGEVIRRAHPCWWNLDGSDPVDWRLEFRDVYLSFAPVQVIIAALSRPGTPPALKAADDVIDDSPEPGLQLAPEDRDAVFQRLEDLPPVSEDDYYAPSTRLEVIDIAVAAIRSNLLAHPERERVYKPVDYDD
jgi:hypothetical protein